MGLMNCFVYSMLSPRNVPATGFSDCHNRPQVFSEAIVFLIHVSVRNILKRFLVYAVQD
jgi:hypothetical protein